MHTQTEESDCFNPIDFKKILKKQWGPPIHPCSAVWRLRTPAM